MFIWYYVLVVVLVSMFERALIAQINLLRAFVGLTVFMLLEFLHVMDSFLYFDSISVRSRASLI